MVKWVIWLWSLTAIILKLCKVGAFTDWEIIAWPWQWSCLCILEWWAIVFTILFIPAFILEYRKQKAKAEFNNIFNRR